MLPTWALQVCLAVPPPGGQHKGGLCTTVETRLSALHVHHHHDSFPRTIPAVVLPVPIPHDTDHRLSRDLMDQRDQLCLCHSLYPVPWFPTSGSPKECLRELRDSWAHREEEAGCKAQAFSGTGGDVKIILLILCKLSYVSEPQSPHLMIIGQTSQAIRVEQESSEEGWDPPQRSLPRNWSSLEKVPWRVKRSFSLNFPS